jgi:hypothetical protein
MALYALSLHPIPKILDRELPGKMTGGRARAAPIVAYADDVIIFVSSVADFAIIEEALRHFERASGTTINPRKSKALAVGAHKKPSLTFNTPSPLQSLE